MMISSPLQTDIAATSFSWFFFSHTLRDVHWTNFIQRVQLIFFFNEKRKKSKKKKKKEGEKLAIAKWQVLYMYAWRTCCLFTEK